MPRPRTRIANLGYNDRSRPVEQSDFARSIPIPNVYILGLLVGSVSWDLFASVLQTASFAGGLQQQN